MTAPLPATPDAGRPHAARRWWPRAAVLVAVALVALAGAVAGYWYLTGQAIRAAVAGWVEERRAAGYHVDHGEPVVTGFPLRWQVRIDRPSIVAPADAWRWRAERITAEASIFTPRDIDYDVSGRHDGELVLLGLRPVMIARVGQATGRLRLGADGRPAELTLEAGGIGLDLRDLGAVAPQQAALGGLSARIATVPAIVAADPVPFGFTVEATDLDLPRLVDPPLGRRINRIAVDGFVRGPIQPGPPAAALAAWRAAGGVVELKRAEIAWGPLDLRAEATVTLDPQMRPLGAGTARIVGFADTIDRFAAARLLPRLAATALKAVLGAKARVPAPGGTPGGGAPVLEVPIEAQDGVLSIAGQRLLPLPALVLP